MEQVIEGTSNGNRFTWVQFLFLRVIVGGILVYAATSKLVDERKFSESVLSYQLTSGQIGMLAASVIPTSELLFGACLVSNLYVSGALLGSLVLSLLFVVAQLSVLYRRMTIHCGCFGALDDALVGRATVGRALVLVSAIAYAFFLQTKASRNSGESKLVAA